MCEGFVRPDAGTIEVLGLDPIADNARLRPRIGVMLQGGGGYPAARAGEMLKLVASYYRRPARPAVATGHAGPDRSGPNHLSTTLRWSTAAARAGLRVGRPARVVLLDEPTAGMDAQARILVWELIDALRRDGVTVVLTTHQLKEAEELADRLVIIDHGVTVASGTPAELTRSGAKGQLRFSAPPRLDLSLLVSALPENYQASESTPGEYLVEGNVDPQVLATVTAWCAQIDVLATDLRVEQRSLEDVFLELTGRELRVVTESQFAAGHSPNPRPAAVPKMLAAQFGLELKLLLRNGEQLLLTMFIPITLLIGLTLLPFGSFGDHRAATFVPAIMALAVISTAFTGQAIAVAFDRRYGALKRLGATALPVWGIIAGKSAAVVTVVFLQSVILGAIGFLLGWRPHPLGLALGAAVIALGTAVFAALGLLLGGTLRAEIVLAVANLLWFVFAGLGALTIESGWSVRRSDGRHGSPRPAR